MILGTLRETMMEKLEDEWQRGYRKAMGIMKKLLDKERARREPVIEDLRGEREERNWRGSWRRQIGRGKD